MDLPAPIAPARVSRRRGRRRYWLVVGAVLALFVLFEVGIRHVPPDGMTVTTMGYSGATYTLFYTAPKDQQTISETYATLHAAPAVSPFAHYNCALGPSPYSVAFTWHGIPVEVWFTGSCVVSDTAGGIPDLTGRLLYLGALPPPASK